jgi:hypothetical protein
MPLRALLTSHVEPATPPKRTTTIPTQPRTTGIRADPRATSISAEPRRTEVR